MLDKYCNIPINWPGLQFDNLVQDRYVRGDVISCILIYIYKRDYDFITLIYQFVEDVISCMRGTHEFHEN
uniref:Uncharacterized protein n=1 Tax=Magallana gigas TaxID=29159 RepID=K1R4L2_MAGGI